MFTAGSLSLHEPAAEVIEGEKSKLISAVSLHHAMGCFLLNLSHHNKNTERLCYIECVLPVVGY